MSEVSGYCDAPVGSCLQTERLENLEAAVRIMREALGMIQAETHPNRSGPWLSIRQLHNIAKITLEEIHDLA